MTFSVFSGNIIQRINLGTDTGSQGTIVKHEKGNIVGVVEAYGMGQFNWDTASTKFFYNNVPHNYTAFYALFNNSNVMDFTLKAGSTAINFGDLASYPLSDIRGKSRSAPPCAGSYEYVASDANNVVSDANNVAPAPTQNRAPVLAAIENKSVNEGQSLSFTVSATDADGDPITYSVQNSPTEATFVNQIFTWTPTSGQAGIYLVRFIADDGQSQASQTVIITVNSVNRPPVLAAIGNKSVDEGQSLSFTVSATDADNDLVAYSVQNLPTGASFANRVFTWTPNYSQAGTYSVIFSASDGTASDSQTITITVNSVNLNQPPVLAAIRNKTIYEGRILSFTVSATDADNDPITYSIQNLPSGASFSNGVFTWTPNYSQAGTYSVIFSASDGQAQTSQTVVITVKKTPSSWRRLWDTQY
jgi:hypothetical protein